MIAFFAICFLYSCDLYKNILPNSFYAVMDNPKLSDGEIMMFRFYICENDTFSMTINGVQLYDKYTPSKLSICTYLDDHTADGHASYNYDFVIYRCSQKRAVMYLLNDQPSRDDRSSCRSLRSQSGTSRKLSCNCGRKHP